MTDSASACSNEGTAPFPDALSRAQEADDPSRSDILAVDRVETYQNSQQLVDSDQSRLEERNSDNNYYSYDVDNNCNDDDDDETCNDPPLLSVLNTVVDFVMLPPDDHFEPNEDVLQVPVLRFFGPAVRRLSDSGERLPTGAPPLQSACLYVHGAYPYMIARPVLAGPDASGMFGCPWDMCSTVERMVSGLTESLESAIQETVNTAIGAAKGEPSPRVVRQITVLNGRGFYTYCPGPTAPFIRVEYYCPSDRWKVKRCLERGLSDLPMNVYHPRAPCSRMNQQEKEDDPLIFNCYEAHIPYTMQIFKDLNLSGMSYIHLSGGNNTTVKFRDNLPASIRKKGIHPTEIESDSDCGFAFLSSNTAQIYRWKPENSMIGQERDKTEAMSKRSSIRKKQTSCDIEVDVSVIDIQNVFEVMTTLPSDIETRQQTHWRAVPSLREIWSQERRRMAKLLKPQDDFLSESQVVPTHATPAFTLNVKRGASQPGAELARKGMQRLVRATDGLEQSFQRSLRQILQRHSAAIDQYDVVVQQKQRNRNKLHDSQSRSLPLTPSFTILDKSDRTTPANLTPSDGEAMEVLDSLASLFAETPQRNSSMGTDHLEKSRESGNSGSRSSIEKSQERFNSLSQEYCSSAVRLNDKDSTDSILTEFTFSQRIDRGEGIVDGAFEHTDDVIDPFTLKPYEIVENDDADCSGDDEESLTEGNMERVLSVLATQTLNPTAKQNNSVASDSVDDSSVDTMTLLCDNEATAENASACTSVIDENETSNLVNLAGNEERETHSSYIWHHPPNSTVQLRDLPPSRKMLLRSLEKIMLHPLMSSDRKNSCAPFTAEYELFRRTHDLDNKNFFPEVDEAGILVQPVSRAPNRRSVASWEKRSKHNLQPFRLDNLSKKRFRANSPNRKQASLRIDENSRKLIATKDDDDDDFRKNGIEEVQWKSTQVSVLSATQDFNDEKERAANLERTDDSAVRTANENSKELLESVSAPSSTSCSLFSPTESFSPTQTLKGIGNQGGRIQLEGGGQLKAKTKQSQAMASKKNGKSLPGGDALPCPVSMMSIEVHTQCRTGRAGLNDSRMIAMTPDSSRDPVAAVVYVLAVDPGGGEPIHFVERACLFVPVAKEINTDVEGLGALGEALKKGMPISCLDVNPSLTVECLRDERQLLLRLTSIVRRKDPDVLMSWDTQSSGIGYLIERGVALGRSAENETNEAKEIDMARLLGRTPSLSTKADSHRINQLFRSEDTSAAALTEMNKSSTKSAGDGHSSRWKGSGLGSDWDDRVGAGAAAASVCGRLVFSAFKIVSEEIKHPNSSYLPAVVSSVLGKRIPYHDNLTLSQWYGHDRGRERWRVLNHRCVQAIASLQLFDALDIVGRSGEAARLSGVEFSQSFPGIRGSQYKVEGVLLRALQSLNSDERGSRRGHIRQSQSTGDLKPTAETKSQTQSPWKSRRLPPKIGFAGERNSQSLHELSDRCYFFFSPSLQNTTKQEALETQALTLEPKSGHQHDPVVVCDFTALYPSLIIAYNLCYSTIAGKLDYHSTRNEMRVEGKTTGKVGPMEYDEERTASVLKHHLKSLDRDTQSSHDRAYVAPTGSVYVAESVVKGVLPQVLDEMLSTRAMLKKAAKQYKKLVPDLSPSVLRQLEARQLALKYVANVTYGYTSATFSGRCAMPLLADTIVECGRRTLTNAINLAKNWSRDPDSRWTGVEVLYGDTDSIFIKVPGRSVQEAFQFGEELCKAVTASNPPPVQLKLEKVYLGSMMQTKKKYCGMKFESKDQKKPTFEAKGIETVRKDQCALTQKVLRNSLVMLFRSGIDAVKAYLKRQWNLILSGSLPVSDFILTGRVRSRYRGGRIGPVQAVLARRLAEADPGRTVKHKERQPFVIVATPGVAFKLKDCVLTPQELLEQWDSFTIHSAYYITKHLNAALQRCLGLAPYHVDVSAWYEACAKPRRRIHFWPSSRSKSSTTMISSFFGSDQCSLCGKKCVASSRSRAAVCQACHNNPLQASASAMQRIKDTQHDAMLAAKKCRACNLCFEDASTFASVKKIDSKTLSTSGPRSSCTSVLAIPLSNCTCIDCPVTFERHRLRECEIEALAIAKALHLDEN